MLIGTHLLDCDGQQQAQYTCLKTNYNLFLPETRSHIQPLVYASYNLGIIVFVPLGHPIMIWNHLVLPVPLLGIRPSCSLVILLHSATFCLFCTSYGLLILVFHHLLKKRCSSGFAQSLLDCSFISQEISFSVTSHLGIEFSS